MIKWVIAIALGIGIIDQNATGLAYTVQARDTLLAMKPPITHSYASSVGQATHLTHMTISAGDRELLAQLVHAEASGEPFKGKVKVAQVVLNRVNSPQFPNTVRCVIMQKGQFSPVANGTIHNSPTASDYLATDKALYDNEKRGDGSLYFFNPAISTDGQWFSSLETTTVIGHHVFKK